MIFHLALEDVEPDHWIAWVLELPACFSPAQTQEQAIARAPARIAAHFEWLASRGRPSPLAGERIETQVAEVFHSFESEPEYIVNAFFEADRRPLAREDVDKGLWLLDCTRRDLMGVVQQIPVERLNQPISGEVQASVAGILRHIGIAEWWYFDRLGLAFPREEWPPDPFALLEKVRAQTTARLPGLIGNTRVVERVGEKWSGPKVLRRALWHERDHTEHVAKLIQV